MGERKQKFVARLKRTDQRLCELEEEKEKGLLCMVSAFAALCVEIAIVILKEFENSIETIVAITVFVVCLIVVWIIFAILIIIFIPFFVISALKRKRSS